MKTLAPATLLVVSVGIIGCGTGEVIPGEILESNQVAEMRIELFDEPVEFATESQFVVPKSFYGSVLSPLADGRRVYQYTNSKGPGRYAKIRFTTKNGELVKLYLESVASGGLSLTVARSSEEDASYYHITDRDAVGKALNDAFEASQLKATTDDK